MGQTTSQIELPRRVVVYYLLFCTIAVAWLTVGVVYVTHAVLTNRTENTCLVQLGKASAAIEIDYIRHGTANLQQVVNQLHAEAKLAYCAVESLEGRYLAHTVADQIGQPAVEPVGEPLRWGAVEGVRFVGENRMVLREYRTVLVAGEHKFGTLRIAVPEPDFWVTIHDAADFAPWTVIGPLGLVCIGAVVMRKMVRPVADVDRQLKQLAHAGTIEDVDLQGVESRGPAALGWNRLVDWLGNQRQAPALEDRLAEAVRARQASRGHEVLNSLSDGIVVTDLEGRVTFANPALPALLGTDDEAQAIVGRAIDEVLGDDGAEADPLKPFQGQAPLRTIVAEISRQNASGQRVLRLARQPVRQTGQTSLAGHVWTVRDVTQQKLAEKMRDQFLDSATHELRTPLANIKAYAETLAMNEMLDVDQQKEFCNTINSEATRLARFIDDLLSLSSIEVGAMSINRQTVDTERLFAEVIAKVQPLMDQKQIAFASLFPEKMPELRLDKDKIAATLVNLLGNAAKYTPNDGRVELKVRLNNEQMIIDVEDTGVGIAKDELPHVFEKFFRSNDSRVQEEIGTGLGLSLAQEVIRLHGGEVLVESELNQGSKFTCTLPLEG